MYGLINSKHYITRSQQRCINGLMENLLLFYGESRKCRGGVDSLFFSRESLQEILNDRGTHIFKMCEKFKNAYIIVSDDGVLITVARSYRRTVH